MLQKLITLSILSALLTSHGIAGGKKGAQGGKGHARTSKVKVPKIDSDDDLLNRAIASNKADEQQCTKKVKETSIFATPKNRDDARFTLMMYAHLDRCGVLAPKFQLDSTLQLDTLQENDWQKICEGAFQSKTPNTNCISFLHDNKRTLKKKLSLNDNCIKIIQWQYAFITTKEMNTESVGALIKTVPSHVCLLKLSDLGTCGFTLYLLEKIQQLSAFYASVNNTGLEKALNDEEVLVLFIMADLVSAGKYKKDLKGKHFPDTDKYTVAGDLYAKTANAGHMDSVSRLAHLIAEGDYKKDLQGEHVPDTDKYTVAGDLHVKAANNGHEESVNKLAFLIDEGRYTKDLRGKHITDTDKSTVVGKLYAKAANGGSLCALNNLAFLIDEGRYTKDLRGEHITDTDKHTVIGKLYAKAANGGHVDIQANLATFIENGWYKKDLNGKTIKDTDKHTVAGDLYAQAAQGENSWAMHNLATLIERGLYKKNLNGNPIKDTDRYIVAGDLYTEAARAGSMMSMSNFATLISNGQCTRDLNGNPIKDTDKYSVALEISEQAVQDGDRDIKLLDKHIKIYCEYGESKNEDPLETLKTVKGFIQRYAPDNNEVYHQFCVHYYLGVQLTDDIKALALSAVEAGHTDAFFLLNEMEKKQKMPITPGSPEGGGGYNLETTPEYESDGTDEGADKLDVESSVSDESPSDDTETCDDGEEFDGFFPVPKIEEAPPADQDTEKLFSAMKVQLERGGKRDARRSKKIETEIAELLVGKRNAALNIGPSVLQQKPKVSVNINYSKKAQHELTQLGLKDISRLQFLLEAAQTLKCCRLHSIKRLKNAKRPNGLYAYEGELDKKNRVIFTRSVKGGKVIEIGIESILGHTK